MSGTDPFSDIHPGELFATGTEADKIRAVRDAVASCARIDAGVDFDDAGDVLGWYAAELAKARAALGLLVWLCVGHLPPLPRTEVIPTEQRRCLRCHTIVHRHTLGTSWHHVSLHAEASCRGVRLSPADTL